MIILLTSVSYESLAIKSIRFMYEHGIGIALFIYRTSAKRSVRFTDIGEWLEIRKAFEKIASTSVVREKARLYAAGSRHDVDERVDVAVENFRLKGSSGQKFLYFDNFLDTRIRAWHRHHPRAR